MNFDISLSSIDLFNIARPRDININCAISDFNGETYYYENSAINQQNSLINSNNKQKKIKVDSYKLSEILKLHNIDKVDFINIDTEGTEFKVLTGIDFKTVNPFLFTIEDNSFNLKNGNKEKKINFLREKKYELINIIGVTMFFVKKDNIDKISELIKI